LLNTARSTSQSYGGFTPPVTGGVVPGNAAPGSRPAGGPVTPAPTTSENVMGTGQTNQGPVAPGQAAPAPAVAGAPAGTPGAGVGPNLYPNIPGTNAPQPRSNFPTKAAYDAYMKTYNEQNAKHAETTAKAQENLPQATQQADQLLSTVDDVINHPGFETNVGVPGITGLLQLPGTAARDWKAKYQQLMGQEFLDAFNGLRGGGAISDKEGATAAKARAALSDPGISEIEFKRNAEILKDTIKKGINQKRIMAGEEPDVKYMLGDQDDAHKKAAYDWAKSHPQDPRSKQIYAKLGLLTQ